MKKNISLVLSLVLSVWFAAGQILYGQTPPETPAAAPVPPPSAPAEDGNAVPDPAAVPAAPAAAPENPAPTPAPEVPAEPPKPYDPKKSLVRLQHPAVAARLGLTDEQRAEVQRLVALRAQELAKAPPEEWHKIHEENDKKLYGILTPAQQTYLPKLFTEKTIRFVFRGQPWADVLPWFAEQAGLQLVMDAPPPGPFNYADQQDYTPSEAIDKLNSILQTKGYTLVRNDKMLMLFNLKRGPIPVQFLPKLKPEELKERGMFEYTTVMFSLERRDRNSVLELLKPFQGTFCHINLMPGNSLMITDTAGNLLVLQKVIESVSNPPVPPPPQPQPPAPPALWRSYLVEKNDPAKIEEIFKEFSPSARILRIGNSNKLHVFLKQNEQSNLETVLKMLEDDIGVTQGELILTSYSISPYLNSPQQFWRLNRFRRPDAINGQMNGQYVNPFDHSLAIGKEIIDVLKKTFPAAVVSDAPVADNIVVLATKAEHEKIKIFFAELKQTPQPEDEMTAKLYKFADPKQKMTEETLKQFKGVVPNAVMTLDEEAGQILIVATAKEQELLAKAFKELETAVIPKEAKKIVSYRLPVSTATRFSSMLKQMTGKKEELEGIVELRDIKQGVITVWATAEQHELIQNLYNEIAGRKPALPAKGGEPIAKPNEPVLRVYPMLNGYAYTAHTVLGNMISGADFSYDIRTNSVIAVTEPDLQDIVAKAVEELDKNIPEDVAFITLKRELPPDMMRQFNRIAPHCVAVQNRRSLQIIITGPKEELDKVKAVLAASEAAEEKSEEVIVHTLQTASPSMVISLLSDIFPEVKATATANNQLILQMNSGFKEPVISLLTQLDGGLEFVSIKKLPSEELLQSIRTIAPQATVVVDKENSQLMLQGTKPDVEKIKKIITQSESVKSIEEEVYVHTFRQAYPYHVVPVLREVYPEVKVVGYPAHAYQLAVRFRPELKEKVLKLFEDIDGDIAVIPLKKPLQPEFANLLARVAPYAVIVPDSQHPQIFVYGPKVDVEKVQKLISTSEAAVPVDDEVYVHTFKSAYPYYAVAVVGAVYPEVKLVGYPTANQLALRFRPELKEKILKLLEELDGDIVIVPLKREFSADLLAAFPKVAPSATVIQDKQNSLAMIYGTKPDIEKIQKMITTTEAAVPFAEEILVHNLKHVESATVVPILQEIYPDLKIKDDAENARLVIRMRPDQKEALASLLSQLDAADPDKERRYFKPYPIETGFYPIRRGRENVTTNMPLNYIDELQKLAPRARIALDENSMQLIVWGTEEEHAAIGAAVKEFSNGGKDKRYGRFQLRRADPYTISAIIRRMFPTVNPTYDWYGQCLIVEGHPRLMEKVEELIESLDPKEPSENDPAVRFYTLNSAPTAVLVRSLQQLIPSAYVVPDAEAKQLMVIAKPAEQKIIESNVKAIAMFAAPEEPMLFIYPATPEQRETLEAFIRTAARDLKGVMIVPDKSPNQISVWAKPSEQQLIATVLKQMQDSKSNEPQRQLKVFQMSIGDLTTAQDILKISHPNAKPFIDKQGNRLLIWATTDELEKITATLTVQAGLDNRQMLAYPVAGTKPETLVKVIADVFQGLKITAEPQSRRILVWASPEEHIKIAEIVEQTNKKEDPHSELAEKFVAYSSVNLDVRTIQPLFRALIPDADVYADMTADKITVRARTRDHVQIAELLEQLRQKDEKLRSVLVVYPYGEADPVMIEAMLRSQLPNAESMTPESVVEQLGYWLSMERYPWYRMNGQQRPKKTGYYKVDPQMQSVFVFVNAEDQKEVDLAMKQVIAAGNQEGAKSVVKRYSLDGMSVYDVWELLRQVAPSAVIQPVFTFSPGQSSMQGIAGFYASRRDFLAYTRESEHTKIDTLIKELNDRAGNGQREMLSVTIPGDAKYSRAKIIEIIQGIYPDLNPLPGGTTNQILVWAQKHKLEKIQQVVEQACKPLPEGQQTVLKTYPLQYISAADAKRWLTAICPNASFDPPATTPGVPRPVLPPGLNTGKTLYVLATPLEHIEIEKAVAELDKDMPVTHKPVPRIYSLDDQPVTAFAPLRLSLIQAFPNAVITPGAEQQTIMVVAAEEEHKKIGDFLKAYKDDREHNRPVLEVYALKKLNYYKVYPLIVRIAPPPQALILPASKPEQIGVWTTPRQHLDISTALTRLETAENLVETQGLRVYKVGFQKAVTASQILLSQFPGALIFAINTDEILAWASDADHEAMSKMLQIVAEAFPEPMLKTYYFKNVPLLEGATILNRLYIGQAVITPRPSTDDLLVQAAPDIHAKIAANIAEFDVPRPEDTESLPVPYNLNELPAAQIYAVASLIRQAFSGKAIVLPSSIPGQIVVLAKVAEQQKIKQMIDTMLVERPEAASSLEIYTINRGSPAMLHQTLASITPNVRYGVSINPNQLPIWANDADHQKIKNIVAKLNEPDKDILTETYPLKNVYTASVYTLLARMIQTQGLDIKYTADSYTNQLVVQARAEDQKLVKELIDKLRKEERDLAVFQLETIDPMTAYYAVNTLFYDEPVATTPEVSPDPNTNMIFVQGFKEQLERTRKLLIEMGETQLQRKIPGTSAAEPSAHSVTEPSINTAGSQMRVLRIKGDASNTIRELEKLWPQYQQNKLRVIRQDEPVIQKKEEEPQPKNTPVSMHRTEGMFFMDDEVIDERKGKKEEEKSKTTFSPVEETTSRLKALVQEAVPNVYVIVNEDGSLTVTSHDTSALDQLEKIVKRIDDRVVFEGRDYTIYTVRNISATLVSMKLQLILRERLAARQPASGYSARFQPPRLEIIPDATTNTIYVRGAKAERTEVANLIAMLDVSELPGQISVTKPVKVPIKNTQAIRVWQQVMNVYQQKMMATRLPGDIFPRVIIDNVTNSLEVMAPEPLASEIKEYAEDLDRRTVEEPARKIHVIPLEVKSPVVQRAIQIIQQTSSGAAMPYGTMPYNPMMRR